MLILTDFHWCQHFDLTALVSDVVVSLVFRKLQEGEVAKLILVDFCLYDFHHVDM